MLRDKETHARLVHFASLFLLVGCATRPFQAQFRSSESAGIVDPGGYFKVPGFDQKGTTVKAVLIRTEPMLTHASLSAATKWAGQVLGSNWKVRPWGTERYTHVAYRESSALSGAGADSVSLDAVSLKASFQKAGGKRFASLELLTSDAFGRERVLQLDDVGHQTISSQQAARNKTAEPSGSPASYDSAANNNAFVDKAATALSTRDPEWSLKFGRVFEAHEWIQNKVKDFSGAGTGMGVFLAGEGVRIGVIDTGYLPEHHEFSRSQNPAPRVDLNTGLNVLDPKPGTLGAAAPLDPFVMNARPPNPGHGSAVIGVLSALRPAERTPLAYAVGVAPGATVVPIRASSSTVYKSPKTIAKAVRELIEKKVHVISISLGGLPELSLEEALEDAQKAGIIVIAAAGNGTRKDFGFISLPGFVVFPAVFPSVIAAGAGTIECKAWGKSAPGVEVDVLAPGENVWYPASYKDASGQMVWSLRRGSGTSFATPYVAALAALWIQANGGYDRLLEHYGLSADGSDRSLIPKAFEVALKYQGLKLPMAHPQYQDPSQSYCTGRDPKLAGRTGAGFVDALNLVKAQLPSAEEVASLYRPALSSQGRASLEVYKRVQSAGFRLFDLNPTAERLVPDFVRSWFGSSPEQTEAFVISYLESRYLGLAAENEKGFASAESQNPEGDGHSSFLAAAAQQVVGNLEGLCAEQGGRLERSPSFVRGVKSVFCDQGFAPFAAEFPLIERGDRVYVLKAFQYLAERKRTSLRNLTIDDKKEMLTALLAGDLQWMPEG